MSYGQGTCRLVYVALDNETIRKYRSGWMQSPTCAQPRFRAGEQVCCVKPHQPSGLKVNELYTIIEVGLEYLVDRQEFSVAVEDTRGQVLHMRFPEDYFEPRWKEAKGSTNELAIAITHLRRLYLHMVYGGSITADDLSRAIARLENLDSNQTPTTNQVGVFPHAR